VALSAISVNNVWYVFHTCIQPSQTKAPVPKRVRCTCMVWLAALAAPINVWCKFHSCIQPSQTKAPIPKRIRRTCVVWLAALAVSINLWCKFHSCIQASQPKPPVTKRVRCTCVLWLAALAASINARCKSFMAASSLVKGACAALWLAALAASINVRCECHSYIQPGHTKAPVPKRVRRACVLWLAPLAALINGVYFIIVSSPVKRRRLCQNASEAYGNASASHVYFGVLHRQRHSCMV
jgi:hypothetical protein